MIRMREMACLLYTVKKCSSTYESDAALRKITEEISGAYARALEIDKEEVRQVIKELILEIDP